MYFLVNKTMKLCFNAKGCGKSRPTTHTYIYCTRIGEDTEWAATHCARADSRLNDCVTRENERGIKKEILIPWLASKVSGLAFYYHFGGGGKVYPDFRTVARRSSHPNRPRRIQSGFRKSVSRFQMMHSWKRERLVGRGKWKWNRFNRYLA